MNITSLKTFPTLKFTLRSEIIEGEETKAMEEADKTVTFLIEKNFPTIRNAYFPVDLLVNTIRDYYRYFKNHNPLLSLGSPQIYSMKIENHANIMVMSMQPFSKKDDNSLWVAVHTWPMEL